MSLSGLSEESAEKKVQALTLCFSRETLSVVQNLGLSDADKQDITAIITAIKTYIDGHINESVECRHFRRRIQQPGESFDDFLLALRELVKTCNFCTNECTQKNICDQLIEGILDGDTVEDLLQIKDLTLDKAIQVCQAQEAAKKQRANMSCVHQESVAAIYAIHHARNHPATQRLATQQPVLDVETDYTKVAELDVQHLVFPVIIVANWVTLLRYAVVDPCYQSPSLH